MCVIPALWKLSQEASYKVQATPHDTVIYSLNYT